MTRFERACKSPTDMAIAVSFCIAAYLDSSKIEDFSDEEKLHDFMDITSDDIVLWLKQEEKGGK